MNRWIGLGFAMLCSGAAAQGMPPPGALDCKMLAGIPNAPMTVEGCERMMASHMELMSALATPGGERPGDDALTCAQIVDEMKTLEVTGVSAANAAEGKAASESVMAIVQRAQAEGMALGAAGTARTAAAAAVPGNVAGGAAATANLAEQQALSNKTAAELAPARDRMNASVGNAMGDLAKSMRENPRFARLMQLTVQRNCSV